MADRLLMRTRGAELALSLRRWLAMLVVAARSMPLRMARGSERAVMLMAGEAAGGTMGREDGGDPAHDRPLPQESAEQESDQCVVD